MKRIIYSKCSNERSPEFSLRTVITEAEDGTRYVEKRPDTKAAAQHVDQIFSWYEKLSRQYGQTGISLNVCRRTENGVLLDYVDYPSLETILDKCVEEKDQARFCRLVQEYLTALLPVHEKEEFHVTDAFRKVFGDVEIPEGERSGGFMNVDALFSNILVAGDGKWCMLDYEWTFDFPIPAKFLIFRIFFYYVHRHKERSCIISWLPREQVGISEEEEVSFISMEYNFQKYIQGNRVPIRDMYDAISPGVIHFDELKYLDRKEQQKRKVQIYMSDRRNITEEDSVFFELENGKFFRKSIYLEKGIKYLRIDPCSKACFVKRLAVSVPEKKCRYSTNGLEMDEEVLFFENSDPYILMTEIEEYEGRELQIEFEVEFLSEDVVRIINNYLKEIHRSELLQTGLDKTKTELDLKTEQCRSQQDLITAMEQTKVWKAYKKYKNLLGEKE